MLRAFGEGGAAKKRPSSTIAGSHPRADGAKFASVGMLLDGQPVSLGMLHDVFKATHLTKDGHVGVKLTKFSEAHFVKNNLSRMNVKLAVQVFSTTMYNLCTVTLPARDPQ